jgi:hypothetical protein
MVTTKGLTTMRARERRKVRVPQAVFLLLVFLGFLQAKNFASAMPGVMATHFGASGSANGWQTKTQFFVVEIVMLGVCLLIGFGIPFIISKAPPSLINLPNKEFWLGLHPLRLPDTNGLVRLRSSHFSYRGQSTRLQRQPVRPTPSQRPAIHYRSCRIPRIHGHLDSPPHLQIFKHSFMT